MCGKSKITRKLNMHPHLLSISERRATTAHCIVISYSFTLSNISSSQIYPTSDLIFLPCVKITHYAITVIMHFIESCRRNWTCNRYVGLQTNIIISLRWCGLWRTVIIIRNGTQKGKEMNEKGEGRGRKQANGGREGKGSSPSRIIFCRHLTW